jgi:hypothetical protein
MLVSHSGEPAMMAETRPYRRYKRVLMIGVLPWFDGVVCGRLIGRRILGLSESAG